nr:hypothetical protein [Tanacetum cinerariifolium]
MSSLFADTHNVVAILEKLDAAEGFEQIIDFLSGSYIHYALTVNPHIYISCIKQFWNTASVKRSGDVTRLQALVDKKNIVIFEAQMGYEKPSTKLTCYKAFFSSQWKFLIHIILQSLSAKRTFWNEFSMAMASAVICLSKGQKFNFSRVGKGFSGVETPLFEGMLAVRQPAEEELVDDQVQVDAAVEENVAEDRVENLEKDNAAQKLVIIKLKARVKRLEMANKVKSSKLRRLRKVGASKQVASSDDMENVFNQGRMIDDMDKDEGIELVKDADIAESERRHDATKQVVTTAKLITEVVTAAASQVNAASATIPAAKPSIPVAAYTRRRKGVIIRDPEEELSSKTPAETLKVKDKGKGILVETPKPIKKKDQIELVAEYARKLHEEINRDEFNKDID